MPTAAQKMGAQLAEKQTALQRFFESHKSKDQDRTYDMTAEEVEQVKAWNDELNDLGTKWQEVRELENIDTRNRQLGTDLGQVQRPDFLMGGNQLVEAKGFGDAVVATLYGEDGRCRKGPEIEVKDYGALQLKQSLALEQKTTMTTGAGWAPATIRTSKVMLTAQRPVIFMDILPTVPLTIGSVYEYMQETTFTNNAAVVAENAVYPESALAFAPVDAPVRKIGTFIPVTEEQLADVEGVRAMLDNRLSFMVMLAADQELLSGDGTGVHINGFNNQVTQSQAKATDPVFDAIFKAMVLVQTVGYANPDAVVLHPLDFQDIRLTRTADGIYIMGNPDTVGSNMLFGMRTVITTAATQNTGLVGDFGTYSALITRMGMDVQATNSHASLFIQDVWTIKARIRIGLAIYRITAFCKVTGI